MTATATKPAAPPVDVVPMSDEQKFLFDMKGWLLIPGVLSADQCKELREFFHVMKNTPEKLAPKDRHSYAGPASALVDHPVAAGVLREILGGDTSPNAWGFRLDGSYLQYRHEGNTGIEPHGGGPGAGPMFAYQCKNQHIYSGLTRVVWELNPVEKGAGGTLLMSGSHKANFNVPPSHYKQDSWLFETYDCPEGSLLFFTENLCHSGATWKSKTPRIAVFNCYTSSMTQYHKSRWDAETIADWPAKRQSLVRGVWAADFNTSPTVANDWYGPDNRAY
ncbi:MAG: phytanoyl-CoA dioxygenase family protein [Planctomycetes bacterium]|nr:phytanoyl-CoA dioxygenase family protein [Planctomycetota bacterium]